MLKEKNYFNPTVIDNNAVNVLDWPIFLNYDSK